MTGAFITFEGGEGSGKSTQAMLLWEAFKAAGIPCVKTREPGGTENAERIRSLLVSGSHEAWDPVTETLLFYAARAEHVNKLVKPSIAQGKTVICDRFADSTLVYQGVARGLSEAYVQSLHRLILGNFAPDLTIILDIAPEGGLKRAAGRGGAETRFESLDIGFHRQVRAGFLAIAEREPGRCLVIDADNELFKLHEGIVESVNRRLNIALRPQHG
jgi:dTMP kinase